MHPMDYKSAHGWTGIAIFEGTTTETKKKEVFEYQYVRLCILIWNVLFMCT
jgi:hypothetical protein